MKREIRSSLTYASPSRVTGCLFDDFSVLNRMRTSDRPRATVYKGQSATELDFLTEFGQDLVRRLLKRHDRVTIESHSCGYITEFRLPRVVWEWNLKRIIGVAARKSGAYPYGSTSSVSCSCFASAIF